MRLLRLTLRRPEAIVPDTMPVHVPVLRGHRPGEGCIGATHKARNLLSSGTISGWFGSRLFSGHLTKACRSGSTLHRSKRRSEAASGPVQGSLQRTKQLWPGWTLSQPLTGLTLAFPSDLRSLRSRLVSRSGRNEAAAAAKAGKAGASGLRCAVARTAEGRPVACGGLSVSEARATR